MEPRSKATIQLLNHPIFRKRKPMPSLDCIGKKAVLNHHKEVPFHLLRCDPDLSVGEPDSWCRETTCLP
jgi:hypothetical protein